MEYSCGVGVGDDIWIANSSNKNPSTAGIYTFLSVISLRGSNIITNFSYSYYYLLLLDMDRTLNKRTTLQYFNYNWKEYLVCRPLETICLQ